MKPANAELNSSDCASAIVVSRRVATSPPPVFSPCDSWRWSQSRRLGPCALARPARARQSLARARDGGRVSALGPGKFKLLRAVGAREALFNGSFPRLPVPGLEEGSVCTANALSTCLHHVRCSGPGYIFILPQSKAAYNDFALSAHLSRRQPKSSVRRHLGDRLQVPRPGGRRRRKHPPCFESRPGEQRL